MGAPILVLTTFPDIDTAQRLAEEMVQAKLAACVNILPAGQSTYVWKGELCKEFEHLAVIKTTENCYKEIENVIQKQHPYELPEIISTPIIMGSKNYLSWLTENTKS
jgi:periplasmic divalent cation tolerance protein